MLLRLKRATSTDDPSDGEQSGRRRVGERKEGELVEELESATRREQRSETQRRGLKEGEEVQRGRNKRGREGPGVRVAL